MYHIMHLCIFLLLVKRRRIVSSDAREGLVALRRQNPVRSTKSYLEGLNRKILTKSMMSSWTQRKDCYLMAPTSKLPNTYFDLFLSHWRLTMRDELSKSQAIVALIDDSTAFSLQPYAQRGRIINRVYLVHEIILPIINAYGKHHETLYIAINLLDRYLAREYIHLTKNYDLAAITCAFIAIKYNEEFDPECSVILKRLGCIGKVYDQKGILSMEKKILCSLDWAIRPITPHVLAYKIIDEMHGFFPLQWKRYIVNIVERVVVSAYSIIEEHPDWDIVMYTLVALMFAYVTVHPTLSVMLMPMIGKITGMEHVYDSKLSLQADDCEAYSFFPITYGDEIQLPVIQ